MKWKLKQFSNIIITSLLLVLTGCGVLTARVEPTVTTLQFYLTADKLPVEVTRGDNTTTVLSKGQTIAISPNDKIAVGDGGLGKLLYSDRITVEILQGTEIVFGSVTEVAGDRIEASLLQNFGHTHITIGENGKAAVILKTNDSTITSLLDDTDFSVCYGPGPGGLTCHPLTRGSIQVFGKVGEPKVYTAPPAVGAYTFNGQAPQPPICFHEQEYKDWLSKMRNGEKVEALGALVNRWYQTPCPGVDLTQPTTVVPTVAATEPPTAAPEFVPPVTPYVQIQNITIDAQNRYVVEYKTYGYTEQLPGMHVHFFFNNVPPDQAGMPGQGPWIIYGGPRPFTKYSVTDRPAIASQMCALVANSDHSVQLNSGNCVDLP
jgi:hypothetical protein